MTLIASNGKVHNAVLCCLARAANAPNCQESVTRFLSKLMKKPNWTLADVAEVQAHVLRRLPEERAAVSAH